MAPPAFSIVVPCYNYGRFLATTLRSVLAQGRDDVEIVVVDDASQDDSVVIARSFGDPVRVIELEENVGPGAAWRAGLAGARGQYVCKLDADDWQLPGFLDRVEAEFERDERIGLVATGVYLYTEGESSAMLQAPASADTLLDEHALRKALLRKFFVRMPGTALRRASIGSELPRTDLRMGEDWEFFIRVLNGWRGSLVNDPLAVYRIHPASLTLTSHSSERLCGELEHLTAVVQNLEGSGSLTRDESRVFGLGVAESYLGTIGPRLATSDLAGVARHLRVAASLASSADLRAVPSLLGYVAWGSWQRLYVRRRRATVPIGPLNP